MIGLGSPQARVPGYYPDLPTRHRIATANCQWWGVCMARVTKRLPALEVEKTKAPGMYADGGGAPGYQHRTLMRCFGEQTKMPKCSPPIARLERRVADLEDAAIVLCNHVEILEEKPKRIAHLLEWKPDGARPM
jgi:hypothetical protein